MTPPSSGLGVVTIDRGLNIQSWNRWLADATGVPEERARGSALVSFVRPERIEVVRALLEDVIATGTTRVLAPAFHRCLIPCAPGEPSTHFTEMQQFVTVAPLHAGPEIAGAIVTLEDVTARLERERQLAAELESGNTSVPEAIQAVVADDWRLRGAAVRAFRERASTEEVEHLLDALRRGYQDLNVVSSALQVLVAAHRDVVSPLIDLLSHSEPDLRMHAALALGRVGDRTAVPALVGTLDDSDVNVTFHAIEALGAIGAAEAIEPLARLAQSDDFFLAFPAIDALAKADDPRVAPVLSGLLANPLLRSAVIDTLAAIGDEESVAALVELVNGSDEPLPPITAALVRIRDRYDESFAAGAHITDLTREALTATGAARLAAAVDARQQPIEPLVTVLGWTGATALPSLLAALGDPETEAAVADAVVLIGSAAVEPLIARLGLDERPVRLAAARLLGTLDDPRAVDALLAALGGPDAEMTAIATTALTRVGDERALEPLLALFSHPHPLVRQSALAAVNAIGAAATAARIAPLLNGDNAHARACAIRVAGYFGFEACVGGIVRGLSDPDEDVRRAAIEQLPLVEDPRALPQLLAALRDETPRNRAAAAHALRAVDEPGVATVLVAALADSDAWVRYFAADALGRCGGRDAVAALASLAAADPAPHVRIAALTALAEIDADAASACATGLVHDPDREVAAAALKAVAGGGPDNDDVLEAVVRSGDPELQRGAVRALAHRSTPRGIEMLGWAARLPEPADLARLGIDGLTSLASRSDMAIRTAAIDALLELASGGPNRDVAVAGLAAVPAEMIDHIAAGLLSPRQAIRLAAVEALARLRDAHASQALLGALGDRDSTVRGAVVAAFGRLGTPAAAEAIAGLASSDPDTGVRRLAADVCRRHRWGSGRGEGA